MRRRFLPVLALVALVAGCLQPAAEVEDEPVVAAAVLPPGLLAAPREHMVPAGDSYTVLWLNATAEDWVKTGSDHWLYLGYEFPEDAEVEGYSVLWGRVEDGTLDVRGSAMGLGGAGAGGSGRSGEPGPASTLAIVVVKGAADPFALRWGAQRELMDFELEGDALPAEVVQQGADGHFAAYLEFASPFSLLFGGAGASTFGFDVTDERVAPGDGVVGAAGTLTIAFDQPVPGVGFHHLLAHAWASHGERVGQWRYEHDVDGEVTQAEGLLPGPFAPRIWAQAAPAEGARGFLALDVVAETAPITVMRSVTIPFDASTVGLEVARAEPRASPLVVDLGRGCVLLGAAGAAPGACRAIDEAHGARQP